MIETATGLVLRTYPLTESSLIVHWLTPALGRIATVAKGARRPKSPFHAKLDLFYLAEFSFQRSRRSELHMLREVGVRNIHGALRRELGYLQQASYCAALVAMATETETPLPEIYNAFKEMLEALPAQPPRCETVLAFEIRLLDVLGLEPKLEGTRLSDSAKRSALELLGSDWPATMRLRLEPGVVNELRRFLHGFLIYHLGHLPKGRDAALPAV